MKIIKLLLISGVLSSNLLAAGGMSSGEPPWRPIGWAFYFSNNTIQTVITELDQQPQVKEDFKNAAISFGQFLAQKGLFNSSGELIMQSSTTMSHTFIPNFKGQFIPVLCFNDFGILETIYASIQSPVKPLRISSCDPYDLMMRYASVFPIQKRESGTLLPVKSMYGEGDACDIVIEAQLEYSESQVRITLNEAYLNSNACKDLSIRNFNRWTGAVLNTKIENKNGTKVYQLKESKIVLSDYRGAPAKPHFSDWGVQYNGKSYYSGGSVKAKKTNLNNSVVPTPKPISNQHYNQGPKETFVLP